MAGCITADLKTVLLGLIEKKKPHELMAMFVEEFMPTCESLGLKVGGAAREAAEHAKRAQQPGWGPTVYYDEKGAKHDYTSPSNAFEELFHVSPSTQIECEVVAGETKCTPKTMVMSFQSRGMIVRGDGEPPPVITHGMTERERVSLHQAWNAKLKSEGKHFTIYHPKSPQAKKIDKPG
jgi:hypothetical protein